MHILHTNGELYPVSSFSVSKTVSRQSGMSGDTLMKAEDRTVSFTIPSVVRIEDYKLPYAILNTDEKRVQMEQFVPSSVTVSGGETEVDAIVGGIQYV